MLSDDFADIERERRAARVMTQNGIWRATDLDEFIEVLRQDHAFADRRQRMFQRQVSWEKRTRFRVKRKGDPSREQGERQCRFARRLMTTSETGSGGPRRQVSGRAARHGPVDAKHSLRSPMSRRGARL